jgi:hypothetical protein
MRFDIVLGVNEFCYFFDEFAKILAAFPFVLGLRRIAASATAFAVSVA